MRTSWTLFTLAGLPIRAHLSVGLLVAYMLWTFGNLGWGLYLAAVLLASILLHELAHSAVAIAFGGRVVSIELQLLGGAAMISRLPPRAWQETLMALAGPACSLALAAALLFGSVALGREVFDPWSQTVTLAVNPYLAMAGFLNLGLGCFNLIPAFPMDGGRVLRSALECFGLGKLRATTVAVRVGQGIAVLWAGLWALSFLTGVEVPCPEAVTGFGAYLWELVFGVRSLLMPLIAYMIWVVGRRELAYVRATTAMGAWR
ncbi:MAG: site-2 protease family protein [Candidatus Spyradenecus sp.]